MPDTEEVKILRIIDDEYEYINKVARLVSTCPAVVPSGVGVAQYLDDLEKCAVSLQKYLYSRARERAKTDKWVEY